ncbi:hypothetical protein FRB99_004309, partial [Tulasnella sp. 403]
MAFRLFASTVLRSSLRAPSSSFRTIATRSVTRQFQPMKVSRVAFTPRFYSAAAGLTKEGVTARIINVLESFEKVDASKLTPSSSFAEDLGLDSLDAVEVVMAIEEEFAIEIPDAEADEIKTIQQ